MRRLTAASTPTASSIRVQRRCEGGSDWIEFVHKLTSDNGYAYVYRKKLRLVPGKPELVIEHALKNTGRKTIETLQYNHNFLVIDHEAVGPDITIHFAFPPKAEWKMINGAAIRGQEIVYSRELEPGEGLFSELEGFGADSKDYDARIENRKTGAGVRITGDRPLEGLYFCSIRTLASAEPYVKLRVEPGRETCWKLNYAFYKIARPGSQGTQPAQMSISR